MTFDFHGSRGPDGRPVLSVCLLSVREIYMRPENPFLGPSGATAALGLNPSCVESASENASKKK